MAEYDISPSPSLRTSRNVFAGGVTNTLTPTFSFITPGNLSVVYDTQDGRFVRIGDLVSCFFTLRCTPTFTNSVGAAIIGGLPYLHLANATTGFVYGGGTLVFFSGVTKALYTQFTLQTAGTSSPRALQIRAGGSGVAGGSVETGNITSAASLILEGFYQYIAASET